LERRACQHERLHDRDREAGGRTAGERAYRAARRRAVDIERAVHMRVEHRDAHGLALVDERDVTEQPTLRHSPNLLRVVAALLRTAAYPNPIRDAPFRAMLVGCDLTHRRGSVLGRLRSPTVTETRAVVLVEGMSDRRAVETLAARRGRELA